MNNQEFWDQAALAMLRSGYGEAREVIEVADAVTKAREERIHRVPARVEALPDFGDAAKPIRRAIEEATKVSGT